MTRHMFVAAAAAAALTASGAFAQTSGPTGSNSPTGQNSRAATSPGPESKPAAVTSNKAKARKMKTRSVEHRAKRGTSQGSMSN